MPRNVKPRRICQKTAGSNGVMLTGTSGCDITFTLDEYETIRRIDYLGMSQQECAEKMLVARTTMQHIYARARSKLARCLVEGATLCIEGGNFMVCKGDACEVCESAAK